VLKTVTLKAKNLPACCHGKESMSNPSTILLACTSGINKPFQNMHVECLINSGPFRYKFKVDDTPDAGKADQLYFVLGL
jgi:hypothetical protein